MTQKGSSQLSVAIIGAGIIGLSIGWQLARANMSVTILDQRHAGKQASWAAAGMLAPYSEAGFIKSDLIEMGKQSLALYPQFLKELQEDSRHALPIEREGTLCAAIDRDDREWLQRQYAFKKSQGMPVHWLSGEEAREIEPLLSPRVASAIWIPSEMQINNHLLIPALKKAFLAQGGSLAECMKITQARMDFDNAWTIQAESGKCYLTDVVINSAGAWANEIQSLFFAEKTTVHPVKGQILSLKMQQHLLLKHMIRTPRVYLAPKQEGVVRVGATSEDQGFNEDSTAGATMELLQNAWEIIPAISEYTIGETFVGLRPVTIDHMPVIGASSVKGAYQAVGHGRSGILLAPYTAYTIKQLITKEFSHASSI
jgi:glycine oxidase